MEIKKMDDTTLKEQLENEMEFAKVEMDLKEKEFLKKYIWFRILSKLETSSLKNSLKIIGATRIKEIFCEE